MGSRTISRRFTSPSHPASHVGFTRRLAPAAANTVTMLSIDGGKTWSGFRGAPGGDDYQNLWINPDDGRIILLVGDQGALVTVNGGETWSSWYNQPTAQIYLVSVSNDF